MRSSPAKATKTRLNTSIPQNIFSITIVLPGQTIAERFEGPIKPRGTNPTRCSKPPEQSERMNQWMAIGIDACLIYQNKYNYKSLYMYIGNLRYDLGVFYWYLYTLSAVCLVRVQSLNITEFYSLISEPRIRTSLFSQKYWSQGLQLNLLVHMMFVSRLSSYQMVNPSLSMMIPHCFWYLKFDLNVDSLRPYIFDTST